MSRLTMRLHLHGVKACFHHAGALHCQIVSNLYVRARMHASSGPAFTSLIPHMIAIATCVILFEGLTKHVACPTRKLCTSPTNSKPFGCIQLCTGDLFNSAENFFGIRPDI